MNHDGIYETPKTESEKYHPLRRESDIGPSVCPNAQKGGCYCTGDCYKVKSIFKKWGGLFKKLACLTVIAFWGCFDVYHPPQPSPTPTETPTPVEAKSPAPFETPSPAPTTPPDLCDLPPSTGPAETCILNPKTKPSFLEDIHEAQRLAENNGFVVGGIVTHELAYTAEIARILRNMGLCAVSDMDEVWVKNSNDFSEHYDVVTSWQEPWDGLAAKCSPAHF